MVETEKGFPNFRTASKGNGLAVKCILPLFIMDDCGIEDL